MSATTHDHQDLLSRYSNATTDPRRPSAFEARVWAWPLGQAQEYSEARRTYLLLAAYDETFTEPAEAAAIAIGRRLGAPGDATAAWCGFGHLTAHLAARNALRLVGTAASDRELPVLTERVITLLWPSRERVVEPTVRAYDAGADLRRHMEQCGYLHGQSHILRAIEHLAGAATSGTPQDPTTTYPAHTAAIVWEMVRHYEDGGVDPVERTAQIAAAARDLFQA